MAGLILLLVFLAGYAVQRGSTCAVAAVAQLLVDRRPQRFLSFLAYGAVALAVMAVASLLGHDVFDRYRGASVLAAPIGGGALFGAGAFINGGCSFGTIARLGRGDAARLGTVAGILTGFAIAGWLGIPSPATNFPSPLVGRPALAILIGSLAALALLWPAARRSIGDGPGCDDCISLPDPLRSGGWHPLRALVLIGLINGSLLLLAAGWPYTNVLMDLARSTGASLGWRSLMSVDFVAGAFAGAITAGLFRMLRGSLGHWSRCTAGGVLMGMGAMLIPGGNDTMLLVGLPLLLPSFVLAYAAMIGAIALLITARVAKTTAPVAPA